MGYVVSTVWLLVYDSTFFWWDRGINHSQAPFFFGLRSRTGDYPLHSERFESSSARSLRFRRLIVISSQIRECTYLDTVLHCGIRVWFAFNHESIFLGGSPFSREHPLPITINKNTHEKKNDRMKTMLVGGFNLSEKYEFVSWNDDIPIWKNLQKNMEKCSKPPTRMKILVIQKRLKSSESKIMTRWLWSNWGARPAAGHGLTSKRVPLNPWVNNDFPKSNYPCTLYTISDAPGNICFDLFGFGSMTRNPVRNQGSCRRMGVSFVFQILKIIEVDAEKNLAANHSWWFRLCCWRPKVKCSTWDILGPQPPAQKHKSKLKKK